MNAVAAYFLITWLFVTISPKWLGVVVGAIVVKHTPLYFSKLLQSDRVYLLKIVTDRTFDREIISDALV